MKNILQSLLIELENRRDLVLITILATKGSTPQVQGASSLFSKGKLITGTLGGGILEADATRRSAKSQGKNSSALYEFNLNADITASSGAICGGTAILLLDANPGKNKEAFAGIEKSVSIGKPGILATLLTGNQELKIERYWIENGKPTGKDIPGEIKELEHEMTESLQNRDCRFHKKDDSLSIFLQPVYPFPKLVIVGAGHIGKALAHMAKLLDFEVTVIDSRPEYANPQNIPDADHLVVDEIGEAVKRMPKTGDTYIVIVSRGHRDDTEALKACINSEAKYIGMIGSKRKVRLMRENFIQQSWASAGQFDRIHAPIGFDINSKTVQEIAVSICAELIQVRNQPELKGKSGEINAIILAAGASKRMGKPKMLLPFGDKSIIETIVQAATLSGFGKIIVVTGSEAVSIRKLLKGLPIETVENSRFEDGMLSSIQCGLKAVSPSADGVMILLGDQPMISKPVIDKVLTSYKNSGKGIIVAAFNGKRGHPILISRKHFREILEFPLEKSLKDLLVKYPGEIEEVETGSPEILRDIDTPEDYMFEIKNK